MYSVYKNLHNGKWSIRDVSSGLVCGHADSVVLTQATTRVSQAGRLRVLQERRKNVHAFIIGQVVSMAGFTPFNGRTVTVKDCESGHYVIDNLEQITYNPYKYTGFVVKKTEQPVPEKMKVVFLNQRVTGAW